MRNRNTDLVSLFVVLMLLIMAFSATAEESLTQFVDEPANELSGTGIVIEPKGVKGAAVYIVRLRDESLATYDGRINSLAATSPASLGTKKLDVNSIASAVYLEHLAAEQAAFLSVASKALNREIEPIYQYEVVYNGIAAIMTSEEASIAAKLPGVLNIQRDTWRQKQTDVTPAFIGASNIWDGSAAGGIGTKGEGIIVGVIDTGIWPEHPSFADDGSFPAPVDWNGGCSTPSDGSQAYTCNNKLIGAKHFLTGYSIVLGGYDGLFKSARDDDGHGTHTASTAAGNENVAVTLLGVNRGIISGIAPRAHVAAYKGLGPQGGVTSDLVAAIDTAVADGVDVLNYSIGGGANDPWTDADSVAFLAARSAGVFVATSAGNSGPGAESVGSPGDAPWITTVGASTSNRHFISDISLTGPDTPPTGLFGASVTTGVNNFNLVDAEGIADSTGDSSGLCLNPYSPGTFKESDVVLCQRGQIDRVLRGTYVQAGGGGGVILYNPTKQGLATDNYEIPAVHVENDIGQKIKDYLAAHPGQVTVSFTAGQKILDTDTRVMADMMASFSSRGPNLTVPDIIKPNVTAPGVQILAGASPQHVGPGEQGELFQAIQGTSMSSPHVAGAAALLAAKHGDWSPAEIESALMTTANVEHVKEDGVTQADPFDIGGGRIDLNVAASAPLVMYESHEHYLAANPDIGGDPKTLNIASLGDSDCINFCGWKRTLRNTTNETLSWDAFLSNLDGTVTPSSFTLEPNEVVDITITIVATDLDNAEWAFGALNIVPKNSNSLVAPMPSTRMPIAIIPEERAASELVTITSRRDAGSYLLQDLVALEITDMTIDANGLVAGQETHILLAEDQTPDEPYDDLDQVWWMLSPVSPGATRIVNEIRAATAEDADLYIGFDSNGNNKPDQDEEICSGTTSSWNEYCNIEFPQGGDWWVLVQNWASSDTDVIDSIFLTSAVVDDKDEGNMTLTAPSSVPALSPFDVRIKYDLPDTHVGQAWYGSFTVGTDAANPGNVAKVEVNLYRLGDDVVKQVDVRYAAPGDKVTYKITIQPNVLDEDVTYQIVDLIPDGMTYVSDSAQASAGSVNVIGNELTWSGTLDNPNQLQPTYRMSTSDHDMNCDTGFNGYVNLEDYDIFTQEPVQGDGSTFAFFNTGGPITFFGQQFESMHITDDGFAVFEPSINYQGSVGNPQELPDLNKPSNIAAMLWQDMKIVYDKDLNHGVSAATAGSDVMIVEYDNIQLINDAVQDYDFEIVMTRTTNDFPGAYEIVFAYDNLSGSMAGPVTIGVENADGTLAETLLNRTNAENVVSNGFMVCFDAILPSTDPVVVTYQATVDQDLEAGTLLMNRAISTTSNIGSKSETAVASVVISYKSFLPLGIVMNKMQ